MKTDKESPWHDDKLERNLSAGFLTKYLCNRYENFKNEKGAETIVFALNSDWGFGKTYFLKNWKLDLEQLDYPVVYFDAWENDFTGDPLVGFIAEVDKALKPRFKKIPTATRLLNTTIQSAKKIIRPATSVLVDIVAKKLTSYSAEQLKEILSNSTDDSTEVLGTGNDDELSKDISTLLSTCATAALKEHADKQASIQTFKKNISALVQHLEKVSSVRLPIFIFVDELDRCRPTYAIELLENIKHLFGVKGVYFVVATNIEQLSHSVSALYGDRFNAEQYLKRFFDNEYLLPEPNNDKFANHLFSELGLDKETRFHTGLNNKIYTSGGLAETLFSIYSTSFGLSLRDQQQIAAALKAITLVSSFKTIHLNYLLFLLIVRHRSHDAFQSLTRGLETVPDRSIFTSNIEKTIIRDIGVSSFNLKSDPFASPTTRTVPLSEIAWTYYSNANKDLLDIQKMNINSYDFPRSVLAKLSSDEMPNPYQSNQTYPSTLRDYPSIVRQAGQLIS